MGSPTRLLLAVAALASLSASSTATTINFKNQCINDIQLWDNVNLIVIPAGGPPLVQNVAQPSLMWRHGTSDQATRTLHPFAI